MRPPPSPLAQPLPWNLVADDYAVDLVPHFERYAADALAAVGVAAGHRIVDVATGPGTLAVLAARRGARVDALDFADGMLAQLRRRAAAEGVEIAVRQGDGMALPYGDDEFDAGCSIFGLFMFADRDRGLRELRRVVKPGGRVAVTSWLPLEQAPALAAVFAAVRARLPGIPFGTAEAPLGTAEGFAAELAAAGFADVALRRLDHAIDVPDIDAFWDALCRTMPPVVLLARSLGDRWPALADAIRGDLRARFGDGPQVIAQPAWLGTGVA